MTLGDRWAVRLERAGTVLAPLAAGLLAFGVTRSTMLPGLGFWDTGEFQAVAPTLGTAHPTGYPTYLLLGWMASLLLGFVGEPAARLNVLSGLLLAVAAGLAVVAVRQAGGRALPALASGALLALTPIPWQIGSFADPHVLHLALAAGILVLLLAWESRRTRGDPGADRWLVAAAALYGLALGNHQLTLLLAPGIAAFLFATDRRILRQRRLVGRCLGALFGVAGLVYLELPIRAAMGASIVYGHPDTPLGFLYVVLGVQFTGGLAGSFSDLAGKGAELAGLVVRQFGVVSLLIPAAFVAVALRRPRLALLTAAWVGVTCFFAASYENAMIERYYLVPVLCVVVWLGVGVMVAVDAVLVGVRERGPGARADGPGAPEDWGVRPARGGRGQPRGRAPVVAALLSALLVAPAAWAAPATRAAVDLSQDVAAERWSAWVFGVAESEAVVVSWWSYSTPLWYRRFVLGERPDMAIVDDRDREDEQLGTVDDVIRASLPTRPVYLVRGDAELASIATRWRLVEVPDPAGRRSLFRVVAPLDGASAPSGG